MDTVGLITGVSRILQDHVDGWATDDAGNPLVTARHPPLDLDYEEYPRATVDIISSFERYSDVEGDSHIIETRVDITVFDVEAKRMNRVYGDCYQALIDHHDDTDENGDPYLENWGMITRGSTYPTLENEGETGIERYQRTMDSEWRTILTKNN